MILTDTRTLTDTHEHICIPGCGGGVGIGSVKGFPLEWVGGERAVYLETSQCQNAEIVWLGLLCFLSKRSSDVFVWGLDDVRVGGTGIKCYDRLAVSALFLAPLAPSSHLGFPGPRSAGLWQVVQLPPSTVPPSAGVSVRSSLHPAFSVTISSIFHLLEICSP